MTYGCPEFQRLHRRDLLRVGGLGVAGWSLADLLRRQAQATDGAPQASQLIVIYLPGGPPHLDMFDMKPEAPAEIRGPWKPIVTRQPGLEICELMAPLAEVADKFTILRSVNQKGYPLEGQHGLSAFWPFVTGNRRNFRGTPKFPLYGSVMSKVRPGPQDLPAYVSLSGPKFHDCYLGPGHEPMAVNADDPKDQLTSLLTASHLDLPTLERRSALLAHVDGELRKLDRFEPLLAGLDDFQQRALNLLRSPKLREAIDLSREDAKSAERYGKAKEGKRILAARRLIEAGVPCVYLDFGSWDSHGTTNLERATKEITLIGQCMAALLSDLDERGLLDRTIVLLGGEMGRTPKLNLPGYGREHWNDAQSFLVAGGGFRRGAVVGATDSVGAFVARDLYNASSLARTIYHLLGIDADAELRTTDNRPLKIVVDDAPLIREALA